MRLVIQRVSRSAVKVVDSGEVVGKIGRGLFILVGVGEDDAKVDAEKLAQKIVKMRIMKDPEGKMNLSVKEVNGEVLAVSQFTLYSDTTKGNRPSFIKAAQPKQAEEIYNHFVAKLKEEGIEVQTGKFGAYMEIDATLDGPVTIII
ncbi:D-tyrosyl-tRNA(Tyr) deacylase [Candidatus Woesebacteria bacterium RIFCSPHIGHO2_01_FULL_38_9]|uniref:D-aminoacyl-tRNA deacylase n=2 Tax=Candidatus Woeseibacteriota TaxID=1752722 RepID=A0A1F7Y1A3_9BACT|nr:MAG: D-tyrosyl-tRNA(Tyr) deacylase [Candidatus Woesebacteria bacterium RIFCSPHIGHO2_01_FULL_38_9]OGM58827.1 MAG: D-tyrosyl-tRNA(Tyr) deacylase [Candidatus Woesebacteria bacterium RIFCSPLOWO2_01_FULL_39_10]